VFDAGSGTVKSHFPSLFEANEFFLLYVNHDFLLIYSVKPGAIHNRFHDKNKDFSDLSRDIREQSAVCVVQIPCTTINPFQQFQ